MNLGKNQDLELTARFWSSQQIKPKLEINDFIIKHPLVELVTMNLLSLYQQQIP